VVWLATLPAWSETTLHVAASADLVTLDPTGTASTNVYTHGLVVYDTLFAPLAAEQLDRGYYCGDNNFRSRKIR
jgi:hypothetical protein